MKCREEFGQTVMAIFYKADPSYEKNYPEILGKSFRKTKENLGGWDKHWQKWPHSLVIIQATG
ncbi:hypothetical protein YC2023_034373 [Brassica napus]